LVVLYLVHAAITVDDEDDGSDKDDSDDEDGAK
jgi:hypothetical protein